MLAKITFQKQSNEKLNQFCLLSLVGISRVICRFINKLFLIGTSLISILLPDRYTRIICLVRRCDDATLLAHLVLVPVKMLDERILSISFEQKKVVMIFFCPEENSCNVTLHAILDIVFQDAVLKRRLRDKRVKADRQQSKAGCVIKICSAKEQR